MNKETVKQEALKRFPYPTSDDDNLILECLSKQSGFIQGVQWREEQSVSVDKALDSVEKAINLAHDKWSNNSATDAIEFAEWERSQKDLAYDSENKIWGYVTMDANDEFIDDKEYTTQQLYEIWKKNK